MVQSRSLPQRHSTHEQPGGYIGYGRKIENPQRQIDQVHAEIGDAASLNTADPAGEAPELGSEVGVAAACCGPGAFAEDLAEPLIAGAGVAVLAEGLRPDARDTVAFMHSQGVDLKVISGDGVEGRTLALTMDTGGQKSDSTVALSEPRNFPRVAVSTSYAHSSSC